MNRHLQKIINFHQESVNSYFLMYHQDRSGLSETGDTMIPNHTYTFEHEKYSIISNGYHHKHTNKKNNKLFTSVKNIDNVICIRLVTYFGCDNNNSWIYRDKGTSGLFKNAFLLRNTSEPIMYGTSRNEFSSSLVSKDEYFNLSMTHDLPSYDLYLLGLRTREQLPATTVVRLDGEVLPLLEELDAIDNGNN